MKMSKKVKDTVLYDELGVSPNVTPEELKKAYYKLARQYHPDRNPDAGERMANIVYAYNILSDPRNRNIYDQCGAEHFKDTKKWNIFQTMKKVIPSIPIKSFFVFRSNEHHTPKTTSTKNQDNTFEFYTIKVNLEDLYTGAVLKFPININKTCELCVGKGKSNGGAPTCDMCMGKGTVQQEKHLNVNIEKGCRDNDVLTFPGEGTNGADVRLSVLQKSNFDYSVNGDDITMEAPINITSIQAENGYKQNIKLLDGNYIDVILESGEVLKNRKKIIANAGLPTKANPSTRGNFIVEFNIL